MNDREKVISELSEHIKSALFVDSDYVDCVRTELLQETVALLKKQDAIEPSFKQGKDGIFVWCCGSCGAYMYHIYDGIDKAKEYAKYCRQCGKKVKWE